MELLNKVQEVMKRLIRCIIIAYGLGVVWLIYMGQELTSENIRIMVHLLFVFQIVIWTVEAVYKYFKSIHNVTDEDTEKEENAIPVEITSEENQELTRMIAIHEAGHAFMAVKKGFVISKVVIDNERGYVRACSRKPYPLQDAQDMRSAILVDYAGAAAEEILTGKIHAGCTGNETADFESAEKKIRQIVALNTGCKVTAGMAFESEMKRYSDKLYREAYRIVMENKDAVERIADYLATKKSVGGEKIEQLVQGGGEK